MIFFQSSKSFIAIKALIVEEELNKKYKKE